MNEFFINENDIYSPKTKRYFKEVSSSFHNGNYRSAIVMLYSTVIADLILKLQDLRDTSEDKKAETILSQIESKRIAKSENGTQYDTGWERTIVNKIAKETNLIDTDIKMKIDHLHDIRNLCAHPALNSAFELYLPSKEMTVAYIKEIFEGVLIKPPYYISSVFDRLTEDLENQKNILGSDYSVLKHYLEKRYFNRMASQMILSIFKKLWKFVFMKDDDTRCIENREINTKCIMAIIDLKKDLIIKELAEDETYYDFSLDNEKCSLLISIFLNEKSLYKIIKPFWRQTFETTLFNLPKREGILSWFLYRDSYEYYNWLINDEETNGNKGFAYETFEKLKLFFSDNDMLVEWQDYSILHFSKSFDFNSADARFRKYIEPILEKITKPQLDKLMNAINENDQVYRRGRSRQDNTIIVKKVCERLALAKEYFDQYDEFKYDEQVFEKIEKNIDL